MLLQPILLFLLAVVVFPSGDAPTRDLKENFFNQRPWFFGLLAALVLNSVLKDVVREGGLPEAANLIFHGVILAISVLGLALKGERGHRPLSYVAVAAFAGYTVLLFFQL